MCIYIYMYSICTLYTYIYMYRLHIHIICVSRCTQCVYIYIIIYIIQIHVYVCIYHRYTCVMCMYVYIYRIHCINIYTVCFTPTSLTSKLYDTPDFWSFKTWRKKSNCSRLKVAPACRFPPAPFCFHFEWQRWPRKLILSTLTARGGLSSDVFPTKSGILRDLGGDLGGITFRSTHCLRVSKVFEMFPWCPVMSLADHLG